MATGVEIADEYEALMAQVIAAAGGCSDEEWALRCAGEERTVGVLFDHIAVGNDMVVEWLRTFLDGRPVTLTPDQMNRDNAEHAAAVADRPRAVTMAHLRDSTRAVEGFIRALTAEQMGRRQAFGVAGEHDVEWVAGSALRHPRRHLESIRAALHR